ncbi:hypothetical protein LUZ60_004279 [Juncus effusus]|nr:hypothetical protein LUZ60_004279 [Juncus effusus]
MGKSKDSASHSKKHKSSHKKPPLNPNPNANPSSATANEILTLLEPYQKDQLITFLVDAIVSDPSLLPRVNQLADSDTSHRKLFVHGFGHDSSKDELHNAFSQFGEIEECNMVCEKNSNRCKGYGFVTFKTRKSASLALKEPHKKIGTRVTTCQLASLGPVPSGSGASSNPDAMARKIYVSNVHAETQPDKLRALFSQFGEIELGPIGFDLKTGKSRGFALFVYKTLEGAKKALEEPYKMFEGRLLHCEPASSNNKRKSQDGSAAPPCVAPGVAPNIPALNLAFYGQNLPYAALLGQNPLLAAAVLNPLLNLNAVLGFDGAARMAARKGNVADQKKSGEPGLLGAYQGPSQTQSGQGSSAGLSVRRFPGFM